MRQRHKAGVERAFLGWCQVIPTAKVNIGATHCRKAVQERSNPDPYKPKSPAPSLCPLVKGPATCRHPNSALDTTYLPATTPARRPLLSGAAKCQTAKLIRGVVAVRSHAQRSEPVADRIVSVAFRGAASLGGREQLIDRVVAVVGAVRALYVGTLLRNSRFLRLPALLTRGQFGVTRGRSFSR
jgi:hypothetical protein